ncbi:MAG TPA: nitroreductase family protein [Thermoguttaceae bacterium]|nr:nitroreductase family protein [Thermoguttaceae bacterium]
MDALEAIHTRRSIRRYEEKPVPEEIVEKLLAAAMSAPSANNTQPWHFVVITDRELLDEIPKINPYAKMARGAPLAILVCGDVTLEQVPGYWVVDCAAAVENLLLATHALGLGAVWTGVYPRRDRMDGFRGLLDLPETVAAHSLIVLGYPAETLPREDRYREDRVHRDGWT